MTISLPKIPGSAYVPIVMPMAWEWTDPRGENGHPGVRDRKGRFMEKDPRDPFAEALGVVRRMMRTSSGGDLGDGGRWASVWNRRNKRIMLIRS